jgi:hypothetical protein
MRAVTHHLLAQGDALADELLQQQYGQVPGLDNALTPGAAHAHARWLSGTFLRDLAARRPPTETHVARCQEFGALRARQGVQASAVVQGHHLAHREMWQRMTERLVDDPTVTPALLAASFAHGLRWLHTLVGAVNRGFVEQDAADRNARERALNQFLTLLETTQATSDPVRSLAICLGFDPDGTFCAVHGQRAGTAHDNGSAPVLPETRLLQNEQIVDVLGPPSTGERWGIGAVRSGLAGACRSILDAKLAYAAAGSHDGRLEFAQAWWRCPPQAQREAVDPLLDEARQVAQARPYLLEAAVAFAETGFSVSRAARKLLVHPNTLSYRLDQWRHLTGLDPRTVSGLVQTLYLAS